jgi:6-phosphofructokinase 1
MVMGDGAKISKLAVLTSGGDAPGMNAAIRAVTRCALDRGVRVLGVRDGFAGLMRGDYLPLDSRGVSGVLHRAGTMLGSSRAPGFHKQSGRARAAKALRGQDVGALVVIGGNGTQQGTLAFSRQSGLACVGIASTIDNDLFGTEASLGTDTALHVCLDAIDKLKVTAASHRRCSIIEVMGRDCGYLALMAGIAGGAESIVVPEAEVSPDEVAEQVREAYERGKSHALVVVAEGSKANAHALGEYFNALGEGIGFELRVTVLGHVQRGGTPSPFDRILGTRLGAAAVESLLAGEQDKLIGWIEGKVGRLDLVDVVGKTKALPAELLDLGRVLAQ